MTCDDKAFGPAVAHGCRGSFDFTLLFEQSIMSIGPSVVLIVLAPPRILQLLKHHRTFLTKGPVTSANILGLRVPLLLLFIAVQVALLVVWAWSDTTRTSVSIAAASLKLADSLAIFVLSVLEYNRTVRPSTLLCLYLAFSAAFDAVQLRTVWLLGDARALPSLTTASFAFKLIILVVESQGKRSYLREPFNTLGHEETSGVFSRASFWWLNPFLWRGFRAVLAPGDLSQIDAQLQADNLKDRFSRAWAVEANRKCGKRLFAASCRALKGPIFAAVIPRLCQSAFNFSQPLLISRVVEYVQDGNDSTDFGYGLIGATAIIYIGLALSMTAYKHMTYRLLVMVRGGLISLVYTKALELESSTLKDGAGKGITLMGTDCESIVQGLTNVHEIWASPIDIGLALFLLHRETGVACVAPVIIAVLSTLCSIQIAKVTRRRQKGWVEAVQERVTLTSSLLTNIKGAKMTGLARNMASGIQALRDVEITRAKAYLRVDALMNACASAPGLISPVATLLIFVFAPVGASSGVLTSSTAFATLSIVALMNQPLALALNALPTFWASMACFDRIQEYLDLDERRDYRLLNVSGTRSNSGSLDAIAVSEATSDPLIEDSGRRGNASRMPVGTATIPLRDMRTNSHSPLAAIKDGCFGYGAQNDCVLRDVNLEIWPSTFYTVTGPIGSGKSTLLRALLSETRCHQGSVSLSSPCVAFCSQEPWLANASLKDNILSGKEIDEVFYKQVLWACGLEDDLKQLPDGDQMVLGDKGTRLSGGQVKRVALARAVYSRLPLVLLDDSFSSLDSKTEKLVFSRTLGQSGLLRQLGCSVLLVTQRTQHALEADMSFVITDSGTIQAVDKQAILGDQGSTADQVSASMGLDAVTAADLGHNREASSTSTPTPPPPRDDLNAARQTGDTAIYWFYLGRVGLINVSVYLFLNALTAFFPRFAQEWVLFWVQDAARESSQLASRHTNAVYGTGYALFSLAGLAAFYLSLLYMFQVIVPRSAQKLHHEQLETAIRAPYSFLNRVDPATILNRFSQDMTLIDIELPSYAIQAFYYLFSCLGQCILVLTGFKYMAALIPAVLVVVYALQKFYLRTSRQLRHMDLEAKSPLYGHMLATCSGLQTLRAFGWERRFGEVNAARLDASQRPIYALYCVQRWLSLVLTLVVAAFATLLVVFGTQMRSATSGSSMGVALVNVVNFAQTLASLITAWTSLETALGAISRIKGFISDVKPEDDFGRSDVDHSGQGRGRRIEYLNASLAYDEDSEPVLQEISLVVEPGMKVGICGRSGSGKSSLFLSLLGMLHRTGGLVSLDGHDMDAMPKERLRAAFNVVPQSAIVPPGTVRNCLDPSGTSTNQADTDQDMITVLQDLGLWNIVSEQGGLDAEASSLALSYGQRQLFAIAKAVVEERIHKENRIVLLDEVTSGLEGNSAALVSQVLNKAFARQTVVAVAHELGTIVDYDWVIVLDAGRIVEKGKPSELLRRVGGWFRALWEEAGPGQQHSGRV
ncbi:hypothetical protein SLS53_009022 [Cytospora paraplurivora]|uniref:ABC transporter n=1 Tax=Cytospora paraplurivora TaxID=2898453 RepID=A0AAN9TWH6_9PEZI